MNRSHRSSVIRLQLGCNSIRVWFAVAHLEIGHPRLTCIRELSDVLNLTTLVLLWPENIIINTFISIELTDIDMTFKWLWFKLVIMVLLLLILWPVEHSLGFDLVTISLCCIRQYRLCLIKYTLLIFAHLLMELCVVNSLLSSRGLINLHYFITPLFPGVMLLWRLSVKCTNLNFRVFWHGEIVVCDRILWDNVFALVLAQGLLGQDLCFLANIWHEVVDVLNNGLSWI